MKPIAALRLRAAGGPTGPVTWNPADKTVAVVLSSGNLVAGKISNPAAFDAVRATAGIDAAGSGYFEIDVSATTAPNSDLISGLELLSANINSYPGSDTFGWGYYHRSGQILHSAGGTAYGGAVVATNVLGVAFKAGKAWFAINNVYQGGGDPVAGTGEALTGLSGTLYPAVSIFAVADVIRGRFKASDFIYAPPTGFNPWDPT